MNYFARPEISNSDLTSLKKYFMPERQFGDIQAAYRFGSLLDAIITEPHRVDFLNHRVDGEQYSGADFEKAMKMKVAFLRDDFCRHILKNSVAQKVSINPAFRIDHAGHSFTLPVRCKWDFFGEYNFLIDGDLKSTACKDEKSFIASLDYFDYDRQGAWYMDIENRDRFMFIGVSKVNFKVFKFAIKRGDPFYERGRAKYQELAFRWWYLFGDLSTYIHERHIESVGHKADWEAAF